MLNVTLCVMVFFFVCCLTYLVAAHSDTQDGISCYLFNFPGVAFAWPHESSVSVAFVPYEPQGNLKTPSFFLLFNANGCTIVKHLKRLLPKASSDRTGCKPQRPPIWPREQMLRLLHVPLLPPLQPHPSCTEARQSQVIRSSKAGGVREERWLSPPSTQALVAEDELFTSAGRMPAGAKAL